MRRYLLREEQKSGITLGKSFDVTIVGSGIAGLYAALHIDEKMSVAVLTKANIEKSNSWYAQGGIAAVMSKDDNVELHVEDTMKAGAGLCDKEAVETLVREGRENIEELIKLNVPFDTNAEGELLITREGGHRCRRIVHCGGDATGRETTKRLGQIVLTKNNIEVMTETYIIDIVTDESGVCGVLVMRGGKPFYHPCQNVIIATGGIGQVYQYTTNPAGAIGDGIAAAARAGATVEKMELVQFHPTTLIPHGKAERLFLISEAVRGEGAILRNSEGKAFMEGVHEMKDLAPRDIVARAILAELERSGEHNVFLDVSSMSAEFFEKRFPTIFSKCKEFGIELTKDMIPVRPGQHYLMGGIKTDLNGCTDIPGLYACGETASTGIHGANRLASNSMLECLVFGKRAALHVNGNNRGAAKVSELQLEATAGTTTNHTRIAELRTRIKHKMTQYVGPIRNSAGLLKAKESIELINTEAESFKLCDSYEFELYNMGQVASMIIDGAIARKESVGAHYMVDENHAENK